MNRPPGDDGDFLVLPDRERRYFAVTMLPAIGLEFVQQASGLRVPASAARPPQPIDLIASYITYEEVTGSALGLGYVLDSLRRVPRDAMVQSCARLLGAYESLGASRREIDEHLVSQWFKEPAATRLRQELKKNRTLVAPQTLLLLMQFALLVSPGEPSDDKEPAPFAALLLALQDDLGGDEEQARQVFRGESESPLFREVVASQHFSSWPSEVSTLGHHHLRWMALPADRSDDPRYVDLIQQFEVATGVAKHDFTAVGTALWVGAEQRGHYPVPATFMDSLTIASEQRDAAIAMLAADPEELRSAISRLQDRFTKWSFDVLRRYPVIRQADGGLLVMSKRLLLERNSWLAANLRPGGRAEGQEPQQGRRSLHALVPSDV